MPKDGSSESCIENENPLTVKGRVGSSPTAPIEIQLLALETLVWVIHPDEKYVWVYHSPEPNRCLLDLRATNG
jgi:hypothetical protein